MSFWYLATTYTNFVNLGAGDLDEAFAIAAENAALLVANGVPVFCPIVHSHPMSTVRDELAGFDHDLWLSLDDHFLEACKGLIVVKMVGWETSFGITYERRRISEMKKPTIYMEDMIFPEHAFQPRYGQAVVDGLREGLARKARPMQGPSGPPSPQGTLGI